MTEIPYDSPKRPITIDKAKEVGRYDQATAAAIEKIRSILSDDVKELDAHPLADIYVQELVRCETIHLMRESAFHNAWELTKHLRVLLDRELGTGFANDLDRLVQRWVGEFKSQLDQATEVERRKTQLEREKKGTQHRSYPATYGQSPAEIPSQTRYALQSQARSEGEFAVEGTPRYGRFDPHRIARIFGPEFAVGFPIEINSDDYVFLLDYDGTILSYGRGEMMGNLLQAADALAHRLEHCFAPA